MITRNFNITVSANASLADIARAMRFGADWTADSLDAAIVVVRDDMGQEIHSVESNSVFESPIYDQMTGEFNNDF